MTTILALFLAWQAPHSEIYLDYRKPIRFSIYSPRMMSQDLLIIDDDETILLFNLKGEFLGAFGEKGQGPGEFLEISRIARFDENTLALLDLRARTLTHFDLKRRQFGERKPYAGLDIVPDNLNAALYRLDWERLPFGIGKASPHYRRVAQQPILKAYKATEAQQNTSPAFHLPSAIQMAWSFNDSHHWVIAKDQKKWVMEQLQRTVWLYDARGRMIKTQNAPLLGFLPPQENLPNFLKQTREMYKHWWYSTSRLLDFNANQESMLFSYTVPTNDPDLYLNRVTVANGQLEEPTHTSFQGHYSDGGGYYLGSNRDQFGFILPVDTDFLPLYKVVFYEW